MESLIYIVEDDEGILEVYDGAFDGLYKTKMFENGKDFLFVQHKSGDYYYGGIAPSWYVFERKDSLV